MNAETATAARASARTRPKRWANQALANEPASRIFRVISGPLPAIGQSAAQLRADTTASSRNCRFRDVHSRNREWRPVTFGPALGAYSLFAFEQSDCAN